MKKAATHRSTFTRWPTCTTSTSCRCSPTRGAASPRAWEASRPACRAAARPARAKTASSPRRGPANERLRDLRLAPHPDRATRGGRRVLPDRRRLGGAGVRCRGRSVAARGGLRRTALRLDGGSRHRFRGRPARRSRVGADARRHLADLHADRLLVRALARAARFPGDVDAAAGGRRGRRRGAGGVLADGVSARGGRPGQPRAAAPDPAGSGGGHDRGAADVGDRAPQPRAGSAGRSPPPAPPRVYDRWPEPPLARMSTPIERARPSDPRMPVSPQLALRVAVLGGAALLMFAIIFFRLWYLQVLTGEQYVQEAAANSVRDLPIAAPRGQIFDREGQPIAASTVTNAVQIVPSALPPAGRPRLTVYRRLGALLGMSAGHIEALVVKGRTALPYAPVTIKTDAGRGVLTVLAERQNEFPGVVQKPVSIRSYPYGEMAAQVLGYVGQVSEGELKKSAFRGVQQGTVIGQEGLEYYYDHYLRGTDGVQRIQVDSAGYPEPTRLAPTPPKAGYSLKVTLDLGLQREGEKALLEGIENARAGVFDPFE